MADKKKFYWIKLKDSFMTSDKVDYLMSQEGGANYIVLYQMLCLKTINTDGNLVRKIGEVILPFDAEKIQRDCKYFSIDTVRMAMNIYKALGMIYEQEDGFLRISDFDDLVGEETNWAIQKRRQRSISGQCPPECLPMSTDNVHTEIEIRDRDKEIDIRDRNKEKDIEIDTDIEVENRGKKIQSSRFVPPTLDEVKDYCWEKGYKIDCERFIDFYAAKGWMIGKNKMKDWKAAVRTWVKSEDERRKPVNSKETSSKLVEDWV